MIRQSGQGEKTIQFGQRFTRSPQFDALFAVGMQLVERAASYLEGEGRKAARRLDQPVSVAYATESMRLTARLLDLATWLLSQRAIRDGSTTSEHGSQPYVWRSNALSRASHIRYFDDLPAGLRQLIHESYALDDQIRQIDKSLGRGRGTQATRAADPVNDQIALLQSTLTISAN
ncbi:MAG: DUF1465 family protein [Hyphomicrobiaceae bacterium]